MRDLEDLLSLVRDPESRRYLGDAIRAYQAGALRSAIVATWVAVALDLVAKIRELASTGDTNAEQFVARLDRNIASRNPAKLVAIEGDLLRVALEDFELIEPRDADELGRLREDCNICAHPAFVRPEVVFEPSSELVRAHLATAVDAVLAQGPTPGKAAIIRLAGLAMFDPEQPSTLDEMMATADERMYVTKRAKAGARLSGERQDP